MCFPVKFDKIFTFFTEELRMTASEESILQCVLNKI